MVPVIILETRKIMLNSLDHCYWYVPHNYSSCLNPARLEKVKGYHAKVDGYGSQYCASDLTVTSPSTEVHEVVTLELVLSKLMCSYACVASTAPCSGECGVYPRCTTANVV